MKDIPVYRFPGAYARENGELELYRASNKANAACKEAIEKAISESTHPRFSQMFPSHFLYNLL